VPAQGPILAGALPEDAESLQGAAGPAGDGGGEPGICELRQDVAVQPSLARQWWGMLLPGPGAAIAAGTAIPMVGPGCPGPQAARSPQDSEQEPL